MSRAAAVHNVPYHPRWRYSLTIRTYRRTRAFESAYVVARTLSEFLRLASMQRIAVLAYCFMPDHVHMLVECLDENTDLALFVKLSKQRSGYLYRQMSGQTLWQDGYHQHLLRHADDPKKVARHLLANPVRAGLVLDPFQYPHLGSSVWSLNELLGPIFRARGKLTQI